MKWSKFVAPEESLHSSVPTTHLPPYNAGPQHQQEEKVHRGRCLLLRVKRGIVESEFKVAVVSETKKYASLILSFSHVSSQRMDTPALKFV